MQMLRRKKKIDQSTKNTSWLADLPLPTAVIDLHSGRIVQSNMQWEKELTGMVSLETLQSAIQPGDQAQFGQAIAELKQKRGKAQVGHIYLNRFNRPAVLSYLPSSDLQKVLGLCTVLPGVARAPVRGEEKTSTAPLLEVVERLLARSVIDDHHNLNRFFKDAVTALQHYLGASLTAIVAFDNDVIADLLASSSFGAKLDPNCLVEETLLQSVFVRKKNIIVETTVAETDLCLQGTNKSSYSNAVIVPLQHGLDVAGCVILADLPEKQISRINNNRVLWSLIADRLAWRLDHLEDKQRDASMKEAGNERLKQLKFMANITQQMRTPLNGVVGTTQLLVGTDLNKEQHRLVETAEQSASQLSDLLDDVMVLLNLERGIYNTKHEIFSMKDMVQQLSMIFGALAKQNQITFSIDYPADWSESFSSDQSAIRQILVCLIGNALKFTKQGSVKVTFEKRPDDIYCIRVRDTGVGIEERRLKTLLQSYQDFAPLEAIKNGGTGLGLAITNGLVKSLKGDLDIRSDYGKGSEFTVTLPLKPAANIAAAVPKRVQDVIAQTKIPLASKGNAKPESATDKKPRVLVVEDIDLNQKVAGLMLEKLGYDVDFAYNGEEAIKAIEANGNEYVGVFMDCQMPVMDGFMATAQIKALQKKGKIKETLPIIAMTAYVIDEVKEKCLSVGMVDFVLKPLKLEECAKVVNSWFKT